MTYGVVLPMNTPKKRCHAHSARTGDPCRAWAVAGKNVCVTHGGAAGSGKGKGNFKHGRYSRPLGKLAAAYESAREDRNLFDLKEPIAALDSVTQRLMAMVDEHDSPEWRRSIKTKFAQMREALSSGDPRAAELLEELGELIDAGASVGSNLEHLGSNLDKLARRIEGAWSIHLQKTQVVNKGEIVEMLGRFLVIVREHAGDRVTSLVRDRLMSEMSKPLPRLAESTDPEPEET